MPLPIIRPDESFFEDLEGVANPKFTRLEDYLKRHWDRAVMARTDQDGRFASWAQNYDAIPAEKERVIPWPKASNFVVPVIRMYVETLQAAILNTIFATKPLFKVKGFPKELQESLEIYLECKALYEWQMYKLAQAKLNRGAKYGTAIEKTVHYERIVLHKTSETDEQDFSLYQGPKSKLVPFEDWYCYPITANSMEEILVQFEQQRYPEEQAERMRVEGAWRLTEEELSKALKQPNDMKRGQQQQQAGVVDRDYWEFQPIECHLEWDLNEDGRWYRVVALLEPQAGKIIDLYYNPYPPHIEIYQDFRPIPKDDFFFGDSFCEVLAQAQEEVSAIHNDRRNSSFLASAPIVKKKSGARIPHAGQPLTPARVYTVDELDDFDVVDIGRNHASDMIPEELHVLTLGQQLIGLNPPKMGQAQGGRDSKGVYNAAGTLAMLAEGNTRQDTNIRDFRESLGRTAKTQFAIQREFAPDDPVLQYLPPDVAQGVQEAMKLASAGRLKQAAFEVQVSDTAHNREVERAQLLQASQIVSQYGLAVMDLATKFESIQNPIIRSMIHDTAVMQRAMSKSLLRSFDQAEAAGKLPDLSKSLEQAYAQQQQRPNGTPAPLAGAGPPPGAVPGRPLLEGLARGTG